MVVLWYFFALFEIGLAAVNFAVALSAPEPLWLNFAVAVLAVSAGGWQIGMITGRRIYTGRWI